MSGKNDKWSMFKNYMHNELGISKEDIRQWLDEAVQHEAKKMVENAFSSFDPKTIVYNMVMKKEFFGNDTLQKEVKQEVCKQLVDKINMSLKD